jgi:hypothetical protein
MGRCYVDGLRAATVPFDAAETGKRKDVAAATDQLTVALEQRKLLA